MSEHSDSFTALKIPLTKCGSFLRKLAPHVYSDNNLPSIVPDKQKSSRLLLLSKNIHSKDLSGLPEELKTWIREQPDVSVTDFSLPKLDSSQNHENALNEGDLISEILPKNVDSNIKKEILKNTIILDLQKEQIPYKNEIAKSLLSRGDREIKTVVMRVDDRQVLPEGLGKFFVSQRYELVAGEPDTTLDIEEDKCHFSFELTKYCYESSMQAERDRVFSYFDNNDVICSLFPNVILALRMAKLGLRVVLNTHGNLEMKELVLKNMEKNGIDASNLCVSTCDTIGFLRKCLGGPFGVSKDLVRHIYIGQLLEDITFLNVYNEGIFIGLGNAIDLHESFNEEKNLPYLYFYFILDVKTVKNKIKEQIVQKLNSSKEFRVFEKEDIEDVALVSEYIQDGCKRIFMVKMRLSAKVLFSGRALIHEILGSEEQKIAGKMGSAGKRSASKDLKLQSEKEVEKDVMERRSPRKKNSGTPAKMLHTEKK